MRKFLVTAVFSVALLGMLSPPVFAQAPAPKVTVPAPVVVLKVNVPPLLTA